MGITLSPWMMAFLVLMTGFAGFVDSAAGGGGLISLPAYLFAGLPPHYTYATNKFSAACGTTFATANFFKNGAMNLKVGILAAIGSFAGSALGAHIVLLLSDELLRTMMFLILPVAAGIMGEKGRFLTLVKPQFEAGRGQVGKNGVVREPAVHARVLQNVREYAAEIGWHVAGFSYSPIKGPKGNIEFLADIRPGAGDMPDDAQIAALVREAHDTLDK